MALIISFVIVSVKILIANSKIFIYKLYCCNNFSKLNNLIIGLDSTKKKLKEHELSWSTELESENTKLCGPHH